MLYYSVRLLCKLLQFQYVYLTFVVMYLIFVHLIILNQVSTVYNIAIATANTEIIANSVIVLFVMEIDENIFSALDAINGKWTAHAAESEEVSTMKEEIERQRKKITFQQEQIDNQREDLRMLHEVVETMQSQVAYLGLWQLRSDKEDLAVTTDIDSAKCVVDTGVQQMDNVEPIALLYDAEEQDVKEPDAAATSSPKTISTCNTFESMATNGSDDNQTHTQERKE